MTANLCVFCAIVRNEAPATIVASWSEAIAIRPLNPVVPGHLLVLPTRHVRDVTEAPSVTAATMRAAVAFAQLTMPEAFNIITSVGTAATQTVFHLHVHLIPRREGDGLLLPWSAPVTGGLT